ncbi:MAG: hypothetical protein COV59_00975 [Candidatus Magasanikbacteria bacterium CG11_big_fil_rev_8_21_14_0_20_39_34]|uniref:DUF3048 domain-containing protein n=1 Tax=Candidatus Magasanikbacteria bacterium CG11_big_fil_rev_8_21_14_0_20_39_34 TaxID=1974653 RepID=A0A2H0N683_9BACT|nr:MAG: hypothetical protein COV59_00975 [Candidatus Magasanikbacteria bacterium CG11_big_fil_rev_8_21_14_0_20_39_34]
MKKISTQKISQSTVLFTIAGLIFFFGCILLYFFIMGTSAPKKGVIVSLGDAHNTQEGDGCPWRNSLTGVCLAEEKQQHISAVMIENHIDARPLSGLEKASVVYEAPVEGNITRFLALFEGDTDVDQIGPVRSARPYYLDWISEYDGALYGHVGGSPEALIDIENYQIFDLNEFYRGWFFWRSQSRFAPHNAYTSSDLLKKAWEQYGGETETIIESWVFEKNSVSSTTECLEDCAQSLEITYSSPYYKPIWEYQKDQNTYERTEKGNSETFVADTLIVESVQAQVIDDVGRLKIETIGQGDVLIFQNGKVIEGTWKKTGRKERTRFFDAQDKEIALHPGKIWITIVPQTSDIEFE